VVLDVRDLTTYFYTYDGVVRALDGVDLKIRRGETLGLVGETGCGKSVTAFSITRLIPDPPGRIMSGRVLLRGSDLLWGLDKEAKFKEIGKSGRYKIRRSYRRIQEAQRRMIAVRGSLISTIFQEPMLALNPVFRVSDQIGEALQLHRLEPIVDSLLAASLKAPDLPELVDRLVDAATRQDTAAMRVAAKELGARVGLASIATEAFHSLRGGGAIGREAMRKEVLRRLRRVQLSGSQRRYLQGRRRLAVIDHALREIYMNEMRVGKPDHRNRSLTRARRRSMQLQMLGYRLPGLGKHARRPLETELFWQTVALLESVTIASPAQVASSFPHELSGGMLQRVMIAMALSSDPEILIADEPTTALDVTIQAQILQLMRDLKSRVGTAVLLITHDLGVIAEVADRVSVMYAGRIVETAPVRELFANPLHPYTQGLLASIPRVDDPSKKLESIPGSVPNLIHAPTGCRFHPRCPHAMPICKEQVPPTTVESPAHKVACFLYHGPEDQN
jgi:peptide/nickel transport system ATP-binding protein